MLQLMLALRKSSGVSYVPLGGTTAMRTMLQALRSNQIVLITADRAVEGESIVTDFFGAPARLPIGPVNLSVRTGAPLVGAFGWRSAGGDVSGVFTRLTLALPEEERTLADVVEAALITQMEQIIRAHPEQWVVFESPWLEPAHVSR